MKIYGVQRWFTILAISSTASILMLTIWLHKKSNLPGGDLAKAEAKLMVATRTRQEYQKNIQLDTSHADYNGHTSYTYINSSNSSFQRSSMSQRMEQISTSCHNTSIWSEIKDSPPYFSVWNHKNVYYCEVPKVGCTYWKRVLMFLSHAYRNRNVHQPSDLDKRYVHFVHNRQFKKHKINKTLMGKMNHKSFMFTRDPFARLWSAYIDKFFLADYWKIGRVYASKAGVKASSRNIGCFKDLTFQDFLIAITKMWPKRFDIHWEPVYKLCGPCHINYTAIGKMETFSEDVDYIKKVFGLTWNETTKHDGLDEVYTITKYNFQLENATKCFNKTDMAERLWKTFQYNGYINKLCEFPVTEFENFNVEREPIKRFMNIVREVNCHSDFDKNLQRRVLMIEAYKKVPINILDKIKHIYKYDFEIFGYDKELLL